MKDYSTRTSSTAFSESTRTSATASLSSFFLNDSNSSFDVDAVDIDLNEAVDNGVIPICSWNKDALPPVGSHRYCTKNHRRERSLRDLLEGDNDREISSMAVLTGDYQDDKGGTTMVSPPPSQDRAVVNESDSDETNSSMEVLTDSFSKLTSLVKTTTEGGGNSDQDDDDDDSCTAGHVIIRRAGSFASGVTAMTTDQPVFMSPIPISPSLSPPRKKRVYVNPKFYPSSPTISK